MERHLRITGEREDIEKIIQEFIVKFRPITYVFSYEEVEDNHHVHAHLEYENVPKKQSLSDFMSKKGFKGKYYHKELDKEPINNLLYVLKDLDIICHNLEQERYEQLIQTTKRINEDKKKNARHKIYELAYKKFITYIDNMPESSLAEFKDYREKQPFKSLSQITDFIIQLYVLDYDKEPPLSHIRGYVLYIAQKFLKDDKISPFCFQIEKDYYFYVNKMFE